MLHILADSCLSIYMYDGSQIYSAGNFKSYNFIIFAQVIMLPLLVKFSKTFDFSQSILYTLQYVHQVYISMNNMHRCKLVGFVD